MTPPAKVYYVETEKYEGERTSYYSVSTKRLYTGIGHAHQFTNANPKRKHKIWVAETTWKLVEESDGRTT